jgi:hypothetical protein
MKHLKSNTGYTLIEALISITVFVGIVVPLMAHVYNSKGQARSNDLVVAESVLEQEIAKAQILSDNPSPEITRTIINAEWMVKFEVNGESGKLQVCKAIAFKNRKPVAEAGFYKYVKK